jgi:hypothetical protein
MIQRFVLPEKNVGHHKILDGSHNPDLLYVRRLKHATSSPVKFGAHVDGHALELA